MVAKPWRGRIVTTSRAAWIPAVQAGSVICPRCGLPIAPDVPGYPTRWHLGHQTDRALGGGHEPTNLHPEHKRCSERAGGQLAQSLRRSARTIPTTTRRSWT